MSATIANARIYVTGGCFEDFNSNTAVHEVYDPATDEWQTLAPLPTAHSGTATAALDGLVLVFGGGEDAGTFEENEAYDPKTDSWTPQYPCSLPSMGAMAAIARVVYVPGSGPVTGGTASSPIPTKPLPSRREGRILSVVSIFQTG